jgi:hypothetical protein
MVNGDLNADEEAGATGAYGRRLEAILRLLPAPVQELAGLTLHDGRFEHVTWEPEAERLHMSVVTPWHGLGSHVVTLTYSGVRFGPFGLEILRDVADDRRTEILETEVDCSDAGDFIHRLLFWPRDELTIYFAGLSLESAHRQDDRVSLLRLSAFSEVLPEDDEEENKQLKWRRG